jgi:hypothetical protein
LERKAGDSEVGEARRIEERWYRALSRGEDGMGWI